MPMQIILTQDVANLGKAGELVTVRPGYGRNYLLPQGLAMTATARNKAQLEHNRKVIERKIATERLKWSLTYQQRHGIASGPVRELPDGLGARIQRLCKRVYTVLCLSGYARIDLRLTDAGEVYVIEANPNPQIARDEDFANAAREGGIDYGQLLQRIVNLGLDWEPTQAF